MKDYRYRYSVRMTTMRGYNTPAGWDTRQRAGRTVPAELRGVPTDAKLARYMSDYHASLAPGGVNAHLGASARATSADIVDHDNDNRVVATWFEHAENA